MNRKGIVLAGGSGTRLKPLTDIVCKQLLPIYDKPMIYYPISVLMLAGIKEIAIISTPKDLPIIENLLGDGSQFGVSFTYLVQEQPTGIAEAFVIAGEFIDNSPVALILGDNIFFGHGLPELLRKVNISVENTIFAYHVNDPERFGVVDIKKGKISSIEEKPKKPKTNYAIPGLYFYTNNVVRDVKSLILSDRGELEITDLNKLYVKNNDLNVEILGRGVAWLDTGTFDSLLEASQFIATLQNRQGLKISNLTEIAKHYNWI
jgi:glucose-1-phosphate thymidylyltransferase